MVFGSGSLFDVDKTRKRDQHAVSVFDKKVLQFSRMGSVLLIYLYENTVGFGKLVEVIDIE